MWSWEEESLSRAKPGAHTGKCPSAVTQLQFLILIFKNNTESVLAQIPPWGRKQKQSFMPGCVMAGNSCWEERQFSLSMEVLAGLLHTQSSIVGWYKLRLKVKRKNTKLGMGTGEELGEGHGYD